MQVKGIKVISRADLLKLEALLPATIINIYLLGAMETVMFCYKVKTLKEQN